MTQFIRDRVYFLLKDPHWTWIWWQVTPETIDKTKTLIGEGAAQAQFTLRILDVTDIIFDGKNSHRSFDVEVHFFTDHWYLRIDESNRNYCVEVGFKVGSQFYPMVRSNTLGLPRDHPSDSTEEQWSRIEI
jgi:hypothetical protein